MNNSICDGRFYLLTNEKNAKFFEEYAVDLNCETYNGNPI